MGLAGWLDAGYAMLIEGADLIWHELLRDLFASSSPAQMERGFENLLAEASYRRAQTEKAEREHRQKTGAPVHVGLVREGELEAAVDEWTTIVADAQAAAAERTM